MLDLSTPDILIDPGQYLRKCLLSGIVSSDEAISLTSVESKRQAILSLALRHGRLSFLVNVIKQCAFDDWNRFGIDCRFFLGWVWNEVSQIKLAIDRDTRCLFDGSGQQLDPENYAKLFGYESTLKSCGLLIRHLISQGIESTKDGLQELEMRFEATELIGMYLKIILWLCRCGLLPEGPHEEEIDDAEVANDESSGQIYPRSLLVRSYDEWRRELQSINPSVIGLSDILLIDGITSHLNKQLSNIWVEEGGDRDALYPPPNIHALVRIYLLESVPLELKHAIMLYFLMDIAYYAGRKRSDVEEMIKLFPLRFHLKLGLSKLVEGIWAIDNKFFEFGLSSLSFPHVKSLLVNETDEDSDDELKNLRNSLQKRLVTSLLYQDRHKEALKLVRLCGLLEIDSEEKERLYISILIRNRQLFQAFQFQRTCRDKKNAEELLMHFFLACEQMNLMNQLFQLPLDSVEEEGLIYYLFNISTSRSAKHLLILYLLLKGKVIEAHQFRESFKEELMATADDELFQRGMQLSAMIDSHLTNLPKSLTKLADEINSFELIRLKDQTPSQVAQKKRSEKPSKQQSQFQPSVPPKTILKTSTVSDTILKLVEEMKETAKEALEDRTITEELVTPFRDKIKQRGLLLTKDAPFVRSPLYKEIDMGQGDSTRRNQITMAIDNRDQSISLNRLGEDSFYSPFKQSKLRFKEEFTSPEVSSILKTPVVKSASKVKPSSKTKSQTARESASGFAQIGTLKGSDAEELSNILSLPPSNSQRISKWVSMQESSLSSKMQPSYMGAPNEEGTATQMVIETLRTESEMDESEFKAHLNEDMADLKLGSELAAVSEISESELTTDSFNYDNISFASSREDEHHLRRRSKKPKDANPTHPMQLRASAKKKPSSKKA